MTTNMNAEQAAKVIWDYLLLDMPLKPADAILALGGNDTRVASRAAELYSQGFAKLVIVSGSYGLHTKDIFSKPESEVFKDILIEGGVPESCILVESWATNTGENFRFTYEMIKLLGMNIRSLIVVQKPYIERRSAATFEKQWPDRSTDLTVTSPCIGFEEFMVDHPKGVVNAVRTLVAQLQRVIEYPSLGYMAKHEVPESVAVAYQSLLADGYGTSTL